MLPVAPTSKYGGDSYIFEVDINSEIHVRSMYDRRRYLHLKHVIYIFFASWVDV
jgi:hypothetical protein